MITFMLQLHHLFPRRKENPLDSEIPFADLDDCIGMCCFLLDVCRRSSDVWLRILSPGAPGVPDVLLPGSPGSKFAFSSISAILAILATNVGGTPGPL